MAVSAARSWLAVATQKIKMEKEGTASIRLGCLSIDRSRFEVRTGKRRVRLTRKEFAVLWTLATESGKAFRRKELIGQAWGENVFVSPRTVDVYIGRLRKKLGFPCTETPQIETVWGIGYRLRSLDTGRLARPKRHQKRGASDEPAAEVAIP